MMDTLRTKFPLKAVPAEDPPILPRNKIYGLPIGPPFLLTVMMNNCGTVPRNAWGDADGVGGTERYVTAFNTRGKCGLSRLVSGSNKVQEIRFKGMEIRRAGLS